MTYRDAAYWAKQYARTPTLTLRDIGEHMGISAEGARLAIRRVDPGAIQRHKDRLAKAGAKQGLRDQERAIRRLQDRLRVATPCVICGYLVVRPGATKTCSPEHADLYRNALHLLDPGRQRRYVAQSILRNPKAHTAHEVQWAKLVMAGKPPPPRARWHLPGSKVSQLLGRYRPDLLPPASRAGLDRSA